MNSSTRAVRCRLSAQRTVTVSFLTLTLYFADTGHRDKEETGEPDRDGGRDRRSQDRDEGGNRRRSHTGMLEKPETEMEEEPEEIDRARERNRKSRQDVNL